MLLWMATDLAWMQCWLWASFAIAVIGGCLSASLIFRYAAAREWKAAASELGLGLWLAGSTVWMYSECSGNHTDSDDGFGALVARYIFWAVLGILILLFICHFRQGSRGRCPSICPKFSTSSAQNEISLPPSQLDISMFSPPSDSNTMLDLRPRSWMLCILSDLAAYEDFHSLSWILVDLSWNLFVKYFWWPVFVLTFAIAFDLTLVSFRVRGGVIDSAHYIFQLVWLLSSLIWVLGDFYIGEPLPSEIISIFSPTKDAPFQSRFWSSIVCLFALLLGVSFHVYWAYSTWPPSSKKSHGDDKIVSIDNTAATEHTDI